MKITDHIRNKYPTLTDAEIIETLEWNKQYNYACTKEVCRKIMLGALWTACGFIVAIISSGIVGCIVSLVV